MNTNNKETKTPENKSSLPHRLGRGIGKEELRNAALLLREYKAAKQSLEERIVEEEQWWKLRHWDVLRKKQPTEIEPSSAWLFNAIINKHADAMDNLPEATCLPREKGDIEDAKTLSSIIPVVLDRNNFEAIYSDNMWYKIKHGVCAWGVFWNSMKEGGIGDIDIRKIDLLNIFWQPGIVDIQQSANLFLVNLEDRDTILDLYPHAKEQLLFSKSSDIQLSDYIYDDNYGQDDKIAVVDWYYKKRVGGKKVLHYCKFTHDVLLYSSENDPNMADGWYEHGQYPIVLDVLYPVDGTPFGFGIIAVTKDPQTYIDKMDKNILENMDWATRVRYFGKKSMGINPDEFLDLDKRIVEVEGDISEEKLRPITVNTLPPIYLSVKQQKIDELKETSANRDFSQGSVSGGVTAASAIASLQEAGNKTSRDMTASANRTFAKVIELVIELIRQFYTENRSFRISGDNGFRFISYYNGNLQGRLTGISPDGEAIYSKPHYDIAVKVQKKNPFSRLSQNELAKELYAMGIFDEGNEKKALAMLNIMDFEGIESIKENLRERASLAHSPMINY